MPSGSPVNVQVIDSFLEQEAVKKSDDLGYTKSFLELRNVQGTPEIETVVREESLGVDDIHLAQAKEHFQKGVDHWSDMKYDLALMEFQKSADLRESVRRKPDEETAKSYLWVGSMCWELHKFDKALHAFRRCLRIRFDISGSIKHCSIVRNWISKVLDAKNIKDKDVYLFKLDRSLERAKRADMAYFKGFYEEAVEEYTISIELENETAKEAPRKANPDSADLSCKLARALVGRGSHEQAILEYRKAVSTYKDYFGRGHHYTTDTCEKIADAARLKGLNDQAVDAYLDTLFQSTALQKQGDRHYVRGETALSLESYEKALRIEEAGLGKLQLPSAAIYMKVAGIYASREDYCLAVTSYSKALSIYDSALGSSHPDTVKTYTLLTSLLSQPISQLQEDEDGNDGSSSTATPEKAAEDSS